MIEAAPLWSVLVLPVVVVVLAYAAAALDAALGDSGRVGEPGTTVEAAVEAAVRAPAREAARLLVQQRRVTLAADTVVWRLGGATLIVAALLAAAVIPLGGYVVADLSVGVVWFNAMDVLAWAALWLVGWGANSAFSLVGGYRFVAQALAYELPLMFALTTPALAAGSLRVGDIAAAQSGLWFAVWMPVAFLVYLLATVAMTFWGPFDQPAHRDIAGGVAAELSGVDRLVFLVGRYLLLTSAAAFAVPLFLGGGQGPLLPGWGWSLVKTLAVLAVLVWSRRRLPTLRMDRFEEFAWMVLVPLTLIQALVVALVAIA